MTLAINQSYRILDNPSLPYKTFGSITDNESVYEAGLNVLTSIRGYAERRPGFAGLETTATVFTAVARTFFWSKWGGTRFFSMVCDVSGGVALVYKYEFGVDSSYVLLHTGATSTPYDFVVSNNTLYYSNGNDARAWSGTGADRKWGIVRPAVPVIGLSGTGINAYSGFYYRVTYGNSSSGHESSSSDLSACTGVFTNDQVDVTLVASADTQVDQIRVYRTTDGGSTAPSQMKEITGSPFTNTNATIADTTADGTLSTRTAPGTTLNDPPTQCARLVAYSGRIFGAASATTYFSGLEELNGRSVNEESWPSGVTGNYYPWPKEVTSQRVLPNGIAVFTGGDIWTIEGDRRDNFRRYKLLAKRGCLYQYNSDEVGNSIAWFDTSRQMWLSDLGEIGLDIRPDLEGINPANAYVAIHISKSQHWVVLLDGATAKLYVFDIDTKQWMPPWKLQGATTATALSSGEIAVGDNRLCVVYNGTKVLQIGSTYLDNGTAFTSSITTGLLNMNRQNNPELNGTIDHIAVETNANRPDDVSILLDDDPSTGTYQSLLDPTKFPNNPQDPPQRGQGANLLKKLYKAMPEIAQCQRASFKFDWNADSTNFKLYNLEAAHHHPTR